MCIYIYIYIIVGNPGPQDSSIYEWAKLDEILVFLKQEEAEGRFRPLTPLP